MSRYIDAIPFAQAVSDLRNKEREEYDNLAGKHRSLARSIHGQHVEFCEKMLKTIREQPTVDAVPVVFINDPFHVVYQAFRELYPDKECEILFDYNVETTDTHERVKGVTIFPDDGSIPQIQIDCEQTIDQICEILAHELAHVALGKPEWDDRELDHGEDFEKVLDAIYDRFNELQGFCADGERKEGAE